jgi:hypothetical protein
MEDDGRGGIGDPGARSRPTESSDYGRAFDADQAGLLRDTAPSIREPISADSPVSGHRPAPDQLTVAAADAPEHDFEAARRIILPAFRPIGTQGRPISSLRAGAPEGSASHAQPLLDEGPVGLPVVYTLAATGFDVVVNGDHLASWAVAIDAVQDAAIANLRAWSAKASWTDEVSGDRRLLSSDTGEGSDAARILLPEVREHLVRELGATGRVLVGLPERHLLVAGTLRPDDTAFAALFAEFVLEQSGGADEPIDRRVFELVDGQLVDFAG